MNLKDFFDSTYDKLILRDLFGKIVPGVLFMLCAVGGLLGTDTLRDLTGRLTPMPWVLTAGFAWLLGFALQYLGERSRLLRTYPAGKDGPTDRMSFYWTWAKFHDLARESRPRDQGGPARGGGDRRA